MPSLCPLAVVKFFVLQAAQGQVCLDDKWADSNASVAVASLNEASNLVSNLGAVATGMTKRYACGAGPNWRASAHEGHSDKVHSPTLRSPSTPHPTSNTRPLTPNLLTPSILGRRAPSSCGSSRQLASCWRPACRLPKHAARSMAVAATLAEPVITPVAACDPWLYSASCLSRAGKTRAPEHATGRHAARSTPPTPATTSTVAWAATASAAASLQWDRSTQSRCRRLRRRCRRHPCAGARMLTRTLLVQMAQGAAGTTATP